MFGKISFAAALISSVSAIKISQTAGTPPPPPACASTDLCCLNGQACGKALGDQADPACIWMNNNAEVFQCKPPTPPACASTDLCCLNGAACGKALFDQADLSCIWMNNNAEAFKCQPPPVKTLAQQAGAGTPPPAGPPKCDDGDLCCLNGQACGKSFGDQADPACIWMNDNAEFYGCVAPDAPVEPCAADDLCCFNGKACGKANFNEADLSCIWIHENAEYFRCGVAPEDI